MGLLAVLYYVSTPLTPNAAKSMMVLIFVVFGLVLAMRRMYKKNAWVPYAAVTPKGLVTSQSGKPHDFKTLSWEDVRIRLERKKRRWRWGSDIARDLRIHLDIASGRKLLACILERVVPTG